MHWVQYIIELFRDDYRGDFENCRGFVFDPLVADFLSMRHVFIFMPTGDQFGLVNYNNLKTIWNFNFNYPEIFLQTTGVSVHNIFQAGECP